MAYNYSMRNPKCDGCPVQKAYANYVVEANFGENPISIVEAAADLTKDDRGVLASMIKGDQAPDTFRPPLRVIPREAGCKGPKRRFLFGKLACRGGVDMVREERTIV